MNHEESKAALAELFGREEWIETMHALGPEQIRGLALLSEGILNEGPLSPKIKHFMLFIIALAKGLESMARLHAEAANKAGATKMEWHEVLMVFVPSRGAQMYRQGSELVGLKPGDAQVAASNAPIPSTQDILEYFRNAMGVVPPFVSMLAEEKTTLLQGYFKLRSENLKDDILPQKFKELMLVSLNTAERYQTGVEIHAKAALACGATHEELLDAMTASILGGGVPGWIEGCQVYLRILPDADRAA